MLKDIILSITEKFHDLGHGLSQTDSMIDAVSGMGHRVKWGHDLEGLINSFDLEGISGVGEWFAHMAKDFTSPDGLPLPFAETIRNLPGVDTNDAINWLCINAADVVELAGEAAILNYFKKNPKAYSISLVVGTALGFIDDNPLLLAYNTVASVKLLQRQGKRPYIFDKASVFMTRTGNALVKVSVGTAAVDVAAGALGIDLAGWVAELVSAVNDGGDLVVGLEGVTELGSAAADIIDGAASLGVGIVVSKGVQYAFTKLNADKNAQLEKNKVIAHATESLKKLVESRANPTLLASQIHYLQAKGYYHGYLPEVSQL